MTAASKTSGPVPRADLPVRNSTHILIVDDNREAGKSLAQMLADSGCDEIRTVRSAARALAIAATFHPAIAFLGNPTPDGLEGNLAVLLQKNSREKGIRLIGLTDRTELPTREEARASGVERFISKPVTQVELDKALKK